LLSPIMPSYAPNPGVLAFIYAASDAAESPAVAFPGPPWGSALPHIRSADPGASFSETVSILAASAQSASQMVVRVTTTPRSYSWILSEGEWIVESGWARLQNHETAAAQNLQAISDASFFLHAKGPIMIGLESKIILRAIREDHLPNSRLGGLWRQVREQLADHQVEVFEISKDDPEYRQNLKLLQEAESRDALPVAVEGAGWLRFSTLDGVEAGPSKSGPPKRAVQVESTSELQYDRDGMIRSVRYDQDGARIPALQLHPLPITIASICASSEQESGGGLIGLLEKRTTALKASEVARLLSISSTQAYRLAESGRIPCFRVGTAVRFDPSDLAVWLRARRVA
jgi:excisionase family DNA binding protein